VMQRAIEVHASFLVHRNPTRARLCKRRNEIVRILDHQMAIERHFRDLSQRSYDRRSHRDVGHEVSIHDIDVDYTAAPRDGGTNLLRQPCKISR